jgi:hypothetical protein
MKVVRGECVEPRERRVVGGKRKSKIKVLCVMNQYRLCVFTDVSEDHGASTFRIQGVLFVGFLFSGVSPETSVPLPVHSVTSPIFIGLTIRTIQSHRKYLAD